jgi:hypothetical protein
MPQQLLLYNIPKDENGVLWKPEALAPFVDRAIWTPEPRKGGREDYAREMLKVNKAIEFHLYVLQHGANLALPEMPNNNQICTRKGEAEALLEQHPEIALHDAETGRVILKNAKEDYFVANTTHPKWRSRFVEHVAEVVARAPFYTYLYLDDVGTQSVFNYLGPTKVKEFPTEDLYFAHTLAYLKWQLVYVAGANGLRMGANLQAPRHRFEAFKQAADVLITDGGAALIEWGWMNHKGELEFANWDNTLQKGEYVIRNGGQLNTVLQRDPRRLLDTKSQAYREFEFALYSQMLISNGEDGMRVAEQYDYFVNIPAIRGIDATLGAAKGEYRKEGDWRRRDFENHGIAVNPQTFEHKLVEPPIVIVDPPVPPVEPPVEPPPVPEPPQPDSEYVTIRIPTAALKTIVDALAGVTITIG